MPEHRHQPDRPDHDASMPLPEDDPKVARTVHVRAGSATTTWFNGEVMDVLLTAEQTGGVLGLVEATVPPGAGPGPHVHPYADETFYLVSGELEFLDGDRVFTAGPGDAVHIPRGTVHRFLNRGVHTAKLLFCYTPGGGEGLFAEGGDAPRAGEQAPLWGPEHFDDRMRGLFEKYGCRYGLAATVPADG
ncbi:cupin domain-containing protein [Streptomyces sp. NPDC054784]